MFDARLVHRVTVYVSHRRRCSRRRSGNGASGSIRQVQGWGGGWRCGWGWGWGEESCRRSNLFPSHQCPYLSFTDTETEQIFRDFMNHACALMLWSIIYSGNIFPNIVDFIQRALIRYFMEHSGNWRLGFCSWAKSFQERFQDCIQRRLLVRLDRREGGLLISERCSHWYVAWVTARRKIRLTSSSVFFSVVILICLMITGSSVRHFKRKKTVILLRRCMVTLLEAVRSLGTAPITTTTPEYSFRADIGQWLHFSMARVPRSGEMQLEASLSEMQYISVDYCGLRLLLI